MKEAKRHVWKETGRREDGGRDEAGRSIKEAIRSRGEQEGRDMQEGTGSMQRSREENKKGKKKKQGGDKEGGREGGSKDAHSNSESPPKML